MRAPIVPVNSQRPPGGERLAVRPTALGAMVAWWCGWAIVGFEDCHTGSGYPFPRDRVRTLPGTDDAAPSAARTIVALVWSQESMPAIG
jgi:hypothetical protein